MQTAVQFPTAIRLARLVSRNALTVELCFQLILIAAALAGGVVILKFSFDNIATFLGYNDYHDAFYRNELILAVLLCISQVKATVAAYMVLTRGQRSSRKTIRVLLAATVGMWLLAYGAYLAGHFLLSDWPAVAGIWNTMPLVILGVLTGCVGTLAFVEGKMAVGRIQRWAVTAMCCAGGLIALQIFNFGAGWIVDVIK